MVSSILFFIVWTVVLFWFATTRTRRAIEIIKNQEEQIEKAKEVFEKNEKIYLECQDKLKLRSEQNDILMQTINNLNNQITEGLNILENFSRLLGKQYLFKQDDGTYYNRYTDEYMTEEEATDWLYSELSSIVNKEE